jgi:hypothetical protein
VQIDRENKRVLAEGILMNSIKKAAVAATLSLFALAGNAATLQLDFDYDFSDPLDPDSQAPDGAGPYMTAVFDDGGSAGSVTLTITLAGDIGSADVSEIYLNVDDSIGIENLSVVAGDVSAVTSAGIFTGTDSYKADADGWFDLYIDLPPPGGDRFTAGESLVFNITGAGITANDFFFQSTPDPIDPNGPFYGAAKFGTTGDGTKSAWIAAVPIPAAVWLFGSASFMKRRKAA